MQGIVHAHSTFSLHDSGQSPLELVLKAKELGIKNVTLTDHGTMLGLDDFMEAGKKHGINAIPGLEAYLEDRSHLILIAKDLKGYKAISFALRDANENQQKIRKLIYPKMKEETVHKYLAHNQHIIVTSACVNGPIGKILLTRLYKKRELEKKQKKADLLKQVYVDWETTFKEYQFYAEEEKTLKQEKKELSPYTKPAFLKKALSDSTLMQKHEFAATQIQKIDVQIKEVALLRKEAKKKVDKLNSKAMKYKNLVDEISSASLPTEKELYQLAYEKAKEYKKLFPYFFMEMQYHGMPEEKFVMQQLFDIARKLQIPLIAANDAHMASKGDEKTRQILRYNYFEQHQEISDADKELYVKNEDEMKEVLSKILPLDAVEEAIENTSILNECHVEIKKENHYPKCNSDKTIEELAAISIEDMKSRGEWTQEHQERFEHEINTIKQMGFVDYHMVVQDYCRMIRELSVIPKKELKRMPRDFSKVSKWIEENGFRAGKIRSPGRGSAAGSLVCYLLGITNVDPIRYGLLFDRYLNPERVTMPDIDTDVKRALRPYIIKYLKWKYGEHAISSIATKTTYGAKNAILMAGRDRASELYHKTKEHEELERKYMYEHTLKISKLIPEEPGQTLIKTEELFSKQYGTDVEKCVIWEHAKLIEGKLSATGVHAGGVVIADNGNINEYVPLVWREDKKVWAAQCDMVQIEEKGLLKMDLLGLNTQDCISDCLQLIEKHHGILIDTNNIPFEEEVFQNIFATGHTNSVFQFESAGMKNMLKRFKPDCIEDLILLVAMYRPGPMQYMDHVIAVKNKKIPMDIKINQLKPLLESTYGSMIYQEQIMKIFQILAGYSLGQADLVRRAMSKKKEEKLKIERKAFLYGDESRGIDGCIKRGINEKDADELFDDIMEFAKYCFNKSHAAAYAIVSYQTAYLKYHYPAEFYCSMLNNMDDDFLPVIEDCRKDNITILPPDINRSYYEFIIENGAIRFGFCGIKGIGNDQIAEEIIDKRNAISGKGEFLSLEDFFIRTSDIQNLKVLPKKFTEALIFAGAFDCFTNNRNELLERYQLMREIKSDDTKKYKLDIFNILKEPFTTCDKSWNRKYEIMTLTTLISENPLSEYSEDEVYGCTRIENLANGTHSIMGFLSAIEEKISKNGKQMQIGHLIGRGQQFDVIFMNHEAKDYFENSIVRIKGQYKNGSFFGKKIEQLPSKISPYYIILDTEEKNKGVTRIMENRSSGYIPLTIEFHYNKYLQPIIPRIVTFYVDMDTIKKLNAKKIQYIC